MLRGGRSVFLDDAWTPWRQTGEAQPQLRRRPGALWRPRGCRGYPQRSKERLSCRARPQSSSCAPLRCLLLVVLALVFPRIVSALVVNFFLLWQMTSPLGSWSPRVAVMHGGKRGLGYCRGTSAAVSAAAEASAAASCGFFNESIWRPERPLRVSSLLAGDLGDSVKKFLGFAGSNDGAHVWQEGPEWEGAALAPIGTRV